MATRADQELLLSYMGRTKLDDRRLAALLDVDQSTVSRLRNGKIKKKDKYLSRLEAYLRERDGAVAVDPAHYLASIAKSSEGLRAVLEALQRFMQENA